MGEITDNISTAFRDFNVNGVSSSGAHEPDKREIRALGPVIEAQIASAAIAGGDLEAAELVIAPLAEVAGDALEALELAIDSMNAAVSAQIDAAVSDAVSVAEGFADAASVSASTAEAASGPTYASTAAGLAATSNGEAFAVDAGGGLVSVYLNSSGTAVLQRTLATTSALAASGGAGLVGFIQSGTGATARTVQSKLRDTVSVKDFGAVGDGVTDDTVAIGRALDAVQAGGRLIFPPGVYKMTASISKTFANGAVVQIIGYGAKIDGRSVVGSVAGDTSLIRLGGARLSGVALGVSASKFATSLTTASPLSAAVNDIALITSTDLWNPTRPYYYKGEMIELRSISGTAIGCHAPLFDSYTNSTTTVYALSMPTVNVEGLEIEMNANQLALVISYSRNPSVRHTKVHGARYTGISLQYCFGGTVDSNEVYDAWYSGTGTSYGVAIGTCQNVVVSKNNLTEARHCITGGGWEPCRDVIYSDNVCTVHPSETVAQAIDQHGNMEFCSVLNNTVNGGIVITGINAVVKNNIVREARNSVAAIRVFQEISSDFYEISGNTIIVGNGTAYGIWHSPDQSSLTVGRFIAQGNNVKCRYRSFNVQPGGSSVSGCSIDSLIVRSNYFHTTDSGQIAVGLVVAGAQFVAVSNVEMSDNIVIAEGHDACYLTAGITNITSINDKFYGNRTAYLCSFSGAYVNLVNPYFEGDIGGAGSSRSIQYRTTGTVRCINPTFKNVTYKAELESGGPALYIEQGWYGATPTVLNNSGARLVNFYGALGRAITYGTAAPVAGTWAVGDRVYNQSPSIGQPKSWVCTVAGTPGTWVSEGNL